MIDEDVVLSAMRALLGEIDGAVQAISLQKTHDVIELVWRVDSVDLETRETAEAVATEIVADNEVVVTAVVVKSENHVSPKFDLGGDEVWLYLRAQRDAP